jgi:hypothetical protein
MCCARRYSAARRVPPVTSCALARSVAGRATLDTDGYWTWRQWHVRHRYRVIHTRSSYRVTGGATAPPDMAAPYRHLPSPTDIAPTRRYRAIISPPMSQQRTLRRAQLELESLHLRLVLVPRLCARHRRRIRSRAAEVLAQSMHRRCVHEVGHATRRRRDGERWQARTVRSGQHA